MRRRLSRDYGSELYEDDFNLAIRLPIESIEMFSKEHLEPIRRSLEEFDKKIIEDRLVTTILITDKDHVDLETEFFLEALNKDEARAISDRLLRDESDKRSAINERVRKIIENLSQFQKKETGSRGKVVGSRRARDDVDLSDIAILPSIKKAIRRGSLDENGGPNVKKQHLREKIYRTKLQTNLCIVVDTSFNPDMKEEISSMIWIIRVILTMAYENRFHVGIVSFSNNSAFVEMPFTTDVDKGYEVIETFDYGGLSPLSSGLKTGMRVLERQRGDRTQIISLMILLTQGKANVPLYPGGFVRRELDYLGEFLRVSDIKSVMIHIGDEEEHRMKELSFKSRSRYYNPPLIEDNYFAD